MTNENKEDEYQFNDLDNSQDLDDDLMTSEVKTSFPADNNLKRVILSGFSVIVIGFLVFKFFAPYFLHQEKADEMSVLKSKASQVTSKSKAMPVKKVVTQAVIPKVAPKANLFNDLPKRVSINAEPSQPIVKVVADPKVSKQIALLEYSSRLTSKKFKKMNSNLGGLKEGVDSLTSKINSLNITISQLSDMVKTQKVMIDKLTPKVKDEPNASKVLRPKLTYQIKALIPGRGWLISSQGVTVTVIKGTALPGYGQVLSIDARHGLVETSSGKPIQFSVSDT